MRSVIIAGVLLITIVVVVLCGGFYTKSTTTLFQEQLTSLQAAVASGTWNTAEKRSQQLHADWKKQRPLLAMLFAHQELDQLEAAFVRLQQYTKGHAKTDALAELSVAKTLMDHLPIKYKISIDNLF